MTSRLSLLLVAGVTVAGCSSPSEGDIPDPPSTPPPGLGSQQGTAGTPQQTPQPTGTGGQGGTTGTVNNGAGGTAPAGTGGTVSAPVGTAGSAGSAGTGTEIPTGSGFALTPVNGFVSGASNEAGIQGYFYTYSDAAGTPPGATTIQPADFAMSAGSAICVSGSASQVLTPAGATVPAYGQYWGGGVALNLADPGNMMPIQGWDRGPVTGFSFNITGDQIPVGAQLRFNVTLFGVAGDPYCASGLSAGPNTIRFSDLNQACYNTPPGGAVPATAQLQAIQWQVATVTDAATPFDFCIENLTALTN